jgi:hypothetical protein
MGRSLYFISTVMFDTEEWKYQVWKQNVSYRHTQWIVGKLNVGVRIWLNCVQCRCLWRRAFSLNKGENVLTSWLSASFSKMALNHGVC